jgi:hypothetical protein
MRSECGFGLTFAMRARGDAEANVKSTALGHKSGFGVNGLADRRGGRLFKTGANALACHPLGVAALDGLAKTVPRDSVSAASFGDIEAGIGCFDQVARTQGIVWNSAGDAYADGDSPMAGGGVRDCKILHGCAHHFADLDARPGPLFGSNRQNSSPP